MKTICFYFQVHQPFRFRRYRFFEIGNSHYYYDDYSNESILKRIVAKSYLPTNKLMLDLIKEYGYRFKISYSISGTALDQFALYAPEVIESFQKLAKTGCVEFIAETYSHSLVSLKNREEFENQVREHEEKIEKYFGKKPTTFRNTELIYSNEIGEWIAEMGYKAMITEGPKHILGWKSPNFVYCNAANPRLKLLLKNFRLSDDLAFRFSNQNWNEYPLTAEKFVGWLKNLDKREETCNMFMNYETFGGMQPKESGIFDFLKAFPRIVFSTSNITFSTPSEVADKFQPVAPLNVVYPISWADEERDITAWLGNELQREAFDKLYLLRDKVLQIEDPKIQTDWKYLQTSDHFYYMCTKFFSDGSVHSYFNPYNSPYDAFINYMNILSDFEIRINQALNDKGTIVIKKPASKVKRKTSKAKLKKNSTKSAPKKSVVKTATSKAAATKTTLKATIAKPKAKTTVKITKPTAIKTVAKTSKPALKVSIKPVAKKAVVKKPIVKKPATKSKKKK